MKPLKEGRWIIPRDWLGECVFVVCSGASLDVEKVKRIRGRIVAVKHVALIRPDADVLFYGGREFLRHHLDLIAGFRGQVVARGDYPGTPPNVKCVSKAEHDVRHRLSDDPHILAGWDTGSAALNMAYLRGAASIVVVGMDMKGGHAPSLRHAREKIRDETHARHREALETMGADLKQRGVKVWNCSPVSTLQCFEKRPLDDFL